MQPLIFVFQTDEFMPRVYLVVVLCLLYKPYILVFFTGAGIARLAAR